MTAESHARALEVLKRGPACEPEKCPGLAALIALYAAAVEAIAACDEPDSPENKARGTEALGRLRDALAAVPKAVLP